MRKILIGLITLLLLGLAIYGITYGFSLGNMHIYSVPSIKEENAKLDKKIADATKLKNEDYPQNYTLLETAYKKLVQEKENYEQMLALGVDENGQPLNKIQEYEIERIWVVMGNYAKKQGVDLKLDVTSNNAISKTYDLTFTAIGGYIQITDFLYDIERDSTLVFKLENFKMLPQASTDELAASFTCKDIKLNITENNSSTNNANTNNTNANSTSTNNTNTTNNSTTTPSTTTTTSSDGEITTTTTTSTTSSGDAE